MSSSQRSSGLPLYLIPIMLGMCGLLFANLLDSPMLRTTVILISVGIPLFAGGTILGRVQSRGFQRVALIGGIALLILGAMVTVADFGGSFLTEWYVSEQVSQISHPFVVKHRGIGRNAKTFRFGCLNRAYGLLENPFFGHQSIVAFFQAVHMNAKGEINRRLE